MAVVQSRALVNGAKDQNLRLSSGLVSTHTQMKPQGFCEKDFRVQAYIFFDFEVDAKPMVRQLCRISYACQRLFVLSPRLVWKLNNMQHRWLNRALWRRSEIHVFGLVFPFSWSFRQCVPKRPGRAAEDICRGQGQ